VLKSLATTVRSKNKDITDIWRCLEIALAAGLRPADFTRGVRAETAEVIRSLFGSRRGAAVAALAAKQHLSAEAGGVWCTCTPPWPGSRLGWSSGWPPGSPGRIPADATVVTVTPVFDFGSAPSRGEPDGAFTVTDQAAVALGKFTPTPSDSILKTKVCADSGIFLKDASTPPISMGRLMPFTRKSGK
jgi:hypothetical protein